MSNNNVDQKVRICLVSISLGRGGAERSTALLSTMLTNVGFDVTIIILTNRIDYNFSGTIYNLGLLKKKPDKPIARFKRFYNLRKYIENQKFDLIIDNRSKSFWKRELFYLNYLYKGQNLLYVMRSFNKESYLTNKDWMTRKIINRTKSIVGVSKEIAITMNKKYNTNHFTAIYNPIEDLKIQIPENWNVEQPYILFVGRLDIEVKNLSLLLNAYNLSGLSALAVPLVIVGEGREGVSFIKNKAKDLNLENSIKHFDYTPNVGGIMSKTHFLVLSSRYEGFPRVLIEALSVGTPVISVDCKSGPKEVIQNEKNGLLVPNHDVTALANAMLKMYTDKELYAQCKAYAKDSVKHLSMEKIELKWKEHILELLNA